jgi:hypothetical protein
MSPQKYEYGIMTDSQMESFAKAYKKIDVLIQKALRTQNPDDKRKAEEAIKAELSKTFPKGYPVPNIELFENKQDTLVATYNIRKNIIYVNVAFPAAQQASFVIHEREHAIQAKKVADYIADRISKDGKPVTAQSIIAESTASALVTKRNRQGEPVLDSNNKPVKQQVTQYISQSVAEAAAKDYNSGKRLNTGQIAEAEKLKESMFSSKGILNREQLQTAIDKANATGSSADVKKAIENYRIGISEEEPAYKIQERFDRIWKKVENQRASISNEETFNPIALVTPLKIPGEELPTESIAQRRAEAIILQLREHGISQDAPEFETVFIGVLNSLESISVDEKQDIAKVQDLDARKVIDPDKDLQRVI